MIAAGRIGITAQFPCSPGY